MRVTRRAIVSIILLVLATGVAIVTQQYAFSDPAPAFRFVTVERGDIQSVVSSTGTLNAVTTVSVGTQVSGQVSALLVDFNDQVKKGQLLARIDPTIAQQGVADAQASLERLEAQTRQAKRDQDRNRELSSQGLIPTSQVEQGGAALEVAQAGEKSAAIALQRARHSLSYTSIYAPIDGVVVERNVNNGQTVAASLSAPQLFLIANDLSHMQILAQVGESDIKKIEPGQVATFTVQAIANRTFTGNVEQVRLQSTTVENVVNYTVVVRLENPERELLPGMTARVDFQVKSATGVLKVANAALRYKPSEELLAQLGSSATPSPSRSPGGAGRPPRVRGSGGQGGGRNQGDDSTRGQASGTLYAMGPDGRMERLRVRTGLSDGTSTEIEGRDIAEGLKVIAGIASSPSTTRAPATNPLGGGQQGGGRRGPGGPGF
jgi:HlyD family secretion protein